MLQIFAELWLVLQYPIIISEKFTWLQRIRLIMLNLLRINLIVTMEILYGHTHWSQIYILVGDLNGNMCTMNSIIGNMSNMTIKGRHLILS